MYKPTSRFVFLLREPREEAQAIRYLASDDDPQVAAVMHGIQQRREHGVADGAVVGARGAVQVFDLSEKNSRISIGQRLGSSCPFETV